MIRTDKIHYISMHKLFKDFVENDKPLPDFLVAEFPSDCLEFLYLKYCLNAYAPEKRDYDLLRNFLKTNVLEHSNIIKGILKKILPLNLPLNLVFDVGAGHNAYMKIIQEIYKEANIILVDKDVNLIDKFFGVIHTDVFDWVKNFKGNENTLIFISEFIHCKKDNLKILDSNELRKCHIVVNELLPNVFIDYRLSLTEGHLIHPQNFKAEFSLDNSNIINYETCFKHYMFYLAPNK